MAFPLVKKTTEVNRSKTATSPPQGSHQSCNHIQLNTTAVAEVNPCNFSLLDSSYKRPNELQERKHEVEETYYIFDERPPVEGRDFLSKDRVGNEANLELHNANDDVRSASYLPPRVLNVANIRELRCVRPEVEPLPLIQNEERVDSGSSTSGDVSSFTRMKIFADDKVESPADVADDVDVDYEYDDYMPQLPGSYFTMDPQAYTLTWSKQPPWAQQAVISPTASDTSADHSNIT